MANPLPVIIHEDKVGIKDSVIDLKGSLQGLTFQIASNTKDTRDHLGKIAVRMMQIVDAVKPEEAGTDLVPADQEVGTDVVPATEAGEQPDATRLLEEIATNTRATAFATAKVYEAITMANREAAEDVLDPNDAEPVDDNPDALPPPTGGAGDDKAPKGVMDFLAIIFGTLLGAIQGMIGGFVKAFKLMINKPLAALGKVFSKIFPKTAANISKVFANITKTFRTIGSSIANMAKTIKGFVMKPFQIIGNVFAKIGKTAKGAGGIFNTIFKRVKSFTNIFKSIGGFMSKIGRVAGMVAKLVGKIFFPLTVLMASFDTIKGAIEGFTKTEGSLMDKIFGALVGAFGALYDFFISFPINLVKNLFSWVAGMLGFDKLKETLDGFEFSFDWMIETLMGFVTNIKNWFLGGIAKIGVPPFKFTIWNPVGKDWEVGFDGYYPFKGMAQGDVEMGQTDTSAAEDTSSSRSSAPSQTETGVMDMEGLDEDQFVRIRNILSPSIPGDTLLVSKTPDAQGAYKLVTEDGGYANIMDDSGAIAKMVESVGKTASLEGTDPSTGDNIAGGTADLNDATSLANQSGGTNIGVGGSTVVGGTTTSVSTTNITQTNSDNSLQTRQQKYSW